LSLKTNMRKLWADHAIWTRQYAVSALDEAPDMVAAKERLLKTPDNIGNSIVPYYGEGTGRKLAELLRKHVLLGVDLIEFAKAGDTKSFETQELALINPLTTADEYDRCWNWNFPKLEQKLSQ